VKEKAIVVFSALIEKEKYVLADFFADWCEPCKVLDEILENVKTLTNQKIFIEKINVDKSKKFSESFQVLSVPVLIFFKNGKQVWRMNGFLTAPELVKNLEKFLDT